MAKDTIILGVVFIVAILVFGGLAYSLAPKFSDIFSDLFSDISGAGNQAQLVWFVELPDGTTEDIEPDTLSVFYGGKEVSGIGFKPQIKLTYTGEITSIAYSGEAKFIFENTDGFGGDIPQQVKTDIAPSGEWMDLLGATSATSDTIEDWADYKAGTYTVYGAINLDVTVIKGEGRGTEHLQGSATGQATIQIVKDTVTLEVTMRANSFSVFPTALT